MPGVLQSLFISASSGVLFSFFGSVHTQLTSLRSLFQELFTSGLDASPYYDLAITTAYMHMIHEDISKKWYVRRYACDHPRFLHQSGQYRCLAKQVGQVRMATECINVSREIDVQLAVPKGTKPVFNKI